MTQKSDLQLGSVALTKNVTLNFARSLDAYIYLMGNPHTTVSSQKKMSINLTLNHPCSPQDTHWWSFKENHLKK